MHVRGFVRRKLAQILRGTQVHIVALIIDIGGTPPNTAPSASNRLLCGPYIPILSTATSSHLDTARREHSMRLKLTHLKLIYIAVIPSLPLPY